MGYLFKICDEAVLLIQKSFLVTNSLENTEPAQI